MLGSILASAALMQYMSGRPRLELGNALIDGLPGRLVRDPGVRFGLFEEGCIQRPEANANHFRACREVSVKRTTAVGAESAELSGRRFELSYQFFPGEQMKVGFIDRCVGRVRRAARLAAGSAMAIAEVTGLSAKF